MKKTLFMLLLMASTASALLYNIQTPSGSAPFPGNVTGLPPWLYEYAPGIIAFNDSALPAAAVFDPMPQDQNITLIWGNVTYLLNIPVWPGNITGNAPYLTQTNGIMYFSETQLNATIQANLAANLTDLNAKVADTSDKMTANDSLKVNKAGDIMTGGLDLNSTRQDYITIYDPATSYMAITFVQFPNLNQSGIRFFPNSGAGYTASTAPTFQWSSRYSRAGFASGFALTYTNLGSVTPTFMPGNDNVWDLGASNLQWHNIFGNYNIVNDTFHRGNPTYIIRDVETNDGLTTQYIPRNQINCDQWSRQAENRSAEDLGSCWAYYGNLLWNTTYKITRTYDGGLIYDGELLTNSKGLKLDANTTKKAALNSIKVKADGKLDHDSISAALKVDGHISIDKRISLLEQIVQNLCAKHPADCG